MNYIINARSNSFKVKDIESFKDELIRETGNEIEIDVTDNKVTLFVNGESGWCIEVIDAETDNLVEVNVEGIIQRHIVDEPGNVAILSSVGYEGLRHLSAGATIITAKSIRLMDFFTMVERQAREIAIAEAGSEIEADDLIEKTRDLFVF